MTTHDDGELRRGFAALRAADQAVTPEFAAMLARQSIARRRNTVTVSLIIAVTSAAAVIALFAVRGSRTAFPAGGIAEWRATSDVLLRMGRPPRFGEIAPLGTSSLDALLPPTLSIGAHK